MHELDLLSTFSEDALGNHYSLFMLLPAAISAASLVSLTLRVLTTTIPEQSIETYEIVKRGRKMSRPSGISGQNLEWEFSYRIDKYFQTYTAISQWLAYIKNPITMAMASDSGVLGAGPGPSTFRSDIQVIGLDTNNIITTDGWTWEGAYPTSQSGIEFSEESGEPLVATVTMQSRAIRFPGQPL